MTREYGVDHLRNDRVFVPDDAREERFAALQAADQILAQLVLDCPFREAFLGKVAVSECAESGRQISVVRRGQLDPPRNQVILAEGWTAHGTAPFPFPLQVRMRREPIRPTKTCGLPR